jgi:hypothetical protein
MSAGRWSLRDRVTRGCLPSAMLIRSLSSHNGRSRRSKKLSQVIENKREKFS